MPTPAEMTKMIRMANGQWVPMSRMDQTQKPYAKKFLIVLHYYEGDRETAEDLCNLIADMERIKNKEADILLFRRFDAKPFTPQTVAKLKTKFDEVFELKCRRNDFTNYPSAVNAMFYDVVMQLAQDRKWREDYYAFLNMETDCVPLVPGWITKLSMAWKEANMRGVSCIGHIHDNPRRHLNGVAVYAIDIWSKIPGGKLSGGPPSSPYDIYQAPNLLPLSEDTPFIVFDYRRPTCTSAFLFGRHKNNLEALLFHGVRDASAREAVRARYVTFSEYQSQRKTVFTYFDATGTEFLNPENKAILSIWQDAWRSRGWNPIVLRSSDAGRNKRSIEFSKWIEELPFKGEKSTQMNRFMRWLALDAMGGGLLVEWDVLPGALVSQQSQFDGMVVLNPRETELHGAYIDQVSLPKWLDEIQGYLATPEDDGNVSDANVARSIKDETMRVDPMIVEFGTPQTKDAKAVHFSRKAIDLTKERGQKKSTVMEKWLRGE